MKDDKGMSLIILLLVVIIVLLCIIVFKNISNENNTENTNANNNSSTNINTENKKSSIVGSWQTGVFIYTFNEDGTASLSGTGINTQEFTYKIKNNKVSLTNIETGGTLEQEYSIKDDKLYIGSVIYTKVKKH